MWSLQNNPELGNLLVFSLALFSVKEVPGPIAYGLWHFGCLFFLMSC